MRLPTLQLRRCDGSLAVAAAVFLAGFPAAGELFAAQPAGRDTEQIDVVTVKSLEHAAPEGLLMRVRLQRITPADPSPINWRHGGEGQGGEVVHGTFPKPGSTADADQTLDVGQWSDLVPVTSLVKGAFPGRLFLTVTAGRPGKVVDRVTRELADYSHDVVFEFEFRYRGAAVKRLAEAGPDGGTVTIVIPAYRLVENVTPADPKFLGELTGVLAYASRRAERLKDLPWAAGPLPKKYLLINNISGYGQAYGYGVRTTDKAVTWAELDSLRQLGTNGLRTPPEFLMKMLRGGQPEAQPFRRGLLMPMMGFPVPRYTAGRANDPEAGCPLGEHVAQRTEEAVKASLDGVLDLPVDEVWGLTVDEIGAVVDQAPEGKAHLSVCPRCAAGFQAWLAAQGLSPADFGKRSWPDVRPLNVWDPQAGSPWLEDSGAAMAAYWTLAFNNHVTAALFTPLRDAIAAANEAKRRALAAGSPTDQAARQPWVYSFALRGNTFLMRGHSLDFFDFYR